MKTLLRINIHTFKNVAFETARKNLIEVVLMHLLNLSVRAEFEEVQDFLNRLDTL